MLIEEAITQAEYDYTNSGSEYHRLVLEALNEKMNSFEQAKIYSDLARESFEREMKLVKIESEVGALADAYNEGRMIIAKYAFNQEVWVVNGQWIGSGKVVAYYPTDRGMEYQLCNNKARALESMWFKESQIYSSYDEAHEAAKRTGGKH